MKHENFYLTTPIYYVNDAPHIGHAYTTILADCVARYARLKGCDAFFLTGTDEHGQKIEEAAKARSKTPGEYADEISGRFRTLWDSFGISYDRFIRTTDEQHKKGVQKAFETMWGNGDIYKGEFEGFYCVSCESFFTQTQLVGEECCPDCGRATQLLKEENYFFRLSKYEKPLLEWYESHENCILPKSRKNEVSKFVEGGLRDLSITRTSFSWGISVPSKLGDPKHIVYVWLDALLNYVTALGYGSDDKDMRYWPAALHIVGKDILKFHAIYWPAFLMSLGLPLPRHVAAHGWWTKDGAKMSKSKGNVVDPKETADRFGLDNLRYFLLREVPFGQDGDFSRRALVDRVNSDLANDLGNLMNRVLGMSEKYFDFAVDSDGVRSYHAEELLKVEQIVQHLEPLLYSMQTHRYLEEIWKMLSVGNKAIENAAPWTKMKEGKQEEAMATIALCANILAKASLLLYPVMPDAMSKLSAALGVKLESGEFEAMIYQNALLKKCKLEKIPPLFPRLEYEEEPAAVVDSVQTAQKQAEAKQSVQIDGIITIDQFFATKLKIGTVVVAEAVEKSTKLLRLEVDLGEGQNRQIVAGIREHYTPQSLVGTQVCVVSNLKPAKLMGMTSEGMILAAKDENGLALMRPEKPVKAGSAVG